MNSDTIKKSKGPKRQTKFPWFDWLSGTFEKPIKLTFGKEIPAKKKPEVFIAQLHQWAAIYKLWAFTSTSADHKTISIYTEPRKPGSNKRPDSKFPYPKLEKPVAKKKAAKKAAPKKAAKKSAKKK